MASESPKRTFPSGLVELLEGFVLVVLRDKPDDLLEYAARYFSSARARKNSLKAHGASVDELGVDFFTATNWNGLVWDGSSTACKRTVTICVRICCVKLSSCEQEKCVLQLILTQRDQAHELMARNSCYNPFLNSNQRNSLDSPSNLYLALIENQDRPYLVSRGFVLCEITGVESTMLFLQIFKHSLVLLLLSLQIRQLMKPTTNQRLLDYELYLFALHGLSRVFKANSTCELKNASPTRTFWESNM